MASDDGEQTLLEEVKRGKFLAFSRMCSNIVCSDMILQLSFWISKPGSPSVFQGRNCQ